MALSMQEKRHVGREVALRSLRARKKDKGIMLQEFCVTTGASPPYAAYLLRRCAKRVILGGVTLVSTGPLPGADRGSTCTVLLWWKDSSGLSPEWRALREETPGSHSGAPTCPGEERDHGPPDPLCMLHSFRWGLSPWTAC
jgi:hypothetical protein